MKNMTGFRNSISTNIQIENQGLDSSLMKTPFQNQQLTESFDGWINRPATNTANEIFELNFNDKLTVPVSKTKHRSPVMHINFGSSEGIGSSQTSVQQSPSKISNKQFTLSNSGQNSANVISRRKLNLGSQTQIHKSRISPPACIQSQVLELKKLRQQMGQIGVTNLVSEETTGRNQAYGSQLSQKFDRNTNFDLQSANTMTQSYSRNTTQFEARSSINTQIGTVDLQTYLKGHTTNKVPEKMQIQRQDQRKTVLIENYHTAKSTCQDILQQKIEKQRQKNRQARTRDTTPQLIVNTQINRESPQHPSMPRSSIPPEENEILKGVPKFVVKLDLIIQDKKDFQKMQKQEQIQKVRAYQVDRGEHYQIVKKNAYFAEQKLSVQQSTKNIQFISANQNEMERAHMNMKINVKRSKVKFQKLFEDGKMYYGCRDKDQEAIVLKEDGNGSDGELSARAERRKQKNLSKVIQLMEGSLRWGVAQREKLAIPLEACLQSQRQQQPLFSGRSNQSEEIETERAQIMKYGRFRYLVAKHFLSKTLQQIDAANNRVNMRQVTKVLMLYNCMDLAFPEQSAKYFSIGKKYSNMNDNLFKNTYARERQYMLQDYSIELKVEFSRIMCNQSYLYDLNCLMRAEIYQAEYFEQAKRTSPSRKGDQISQAMQTQASLLKKEQSMIVPYLIGFLEKTIYIKDRVISPTYAEAISQFLVQTAGVPEFQVHQLIIETCNFLDETLKTILEGIALQGSHIKAVIINNSEFGKDSVNMICKILPELRELRINNINDFSPILSRQMLETILEKGKQVQILKLSNISLNCDKSMTILCKYIRENRYFHTLELSNSCLRPRHLFFIARTLKILTQQLKVLDLSYNSLWTGSVKNTEAQILKLQKAKITPASPSKTGLDMKNEFLFDEDYAMMFMDAMVEYIKDTDLLNHLNLSGLQLKYVAGGMKFQQLAQAMHQCSNLLSIHLSDNDLIIDKERADCDPTGAMQDELEYFEDSINIFGLKYSDVFPMKHRCSGLHNSKKPISDDNFTGIVRQAHLVGLTKNVDLFSSMKSQMGSTFRSTTSTAMDSLRRKKVIADQALYEERYQLMIEKQLKFVSQNKFLHDSRQHGGIGRSKCENQADVMILTRQCTYPELIFNQNFRKDKYVTNPIDRCFDTQNAFKWNFSNKDDSCYICQKHTYTVIFFDQNDFENNHDLVEINDVASVCKIRNHLNKINGGNKADNKLITKTPHIFGSIVKQEKTNDLDIETGIVQGPGDKDFKRSLRMMRADLFTLLSISQTIKYIKKKKDFRAINDGIYNMLQMQEIQESNPPSKSQQNTPREKFFSPRTVSEINTTNINGQTLRKQNTKFEEVNRLRKQSTIISTQILEKESSKSISGTVPSIKPTSAKKTIMDEDEDESLEQSNINNKDNEDNEDNEDKPKNIDIGSNPDFLKKLNGWNKYLADKCTQNELMDVRRINYPKNLKNIKEKYGKEEAPGTYTFACILPPGYHQFIIYDPVSQRAFCKEMVIDLNNQTEQFPELPRQIGAKNLSVSVPNVWHPWKIDSKQNKMMALNNDIKQQTIELDLFIKSRGQIDEDAIKQIHELIKTNWEVFKTSQKIMSVESNKYPDINFEVIMKHLLSMQTNQTDLTGRQPKLNRGQFELLFIRSCRNDEKGLASFMGRGEMLEICARYSQQAFKSRDHVGNFSRFIEQHLRPVHDSSDLVLHRKEIQGSEKVNWLLHDNKNQLKKIFDDFKENKVGFTMKSANKLFNTKGILPKKKQMMEALRAGIALRLKQGGVEISAAAPATDTGQLTLIEVPQLIKCFSFSQMTVLDEQKNRNRYNRLVYVEFLEMVCRVAIHVSTDPHQLVEDKIYDLLSILFERRYLTGRDTKETFPLREVKPDEDESEEY